MLSTDPSYDNRTIASTLKMQIRTVQCLRAQLNASGDPLEVLERKDTSSHLRNQHESQHQSIRECAEEYGNPLVQSGGRWQTLGVAAGLGAGPQVERDPGLASEGVLRLSTLLSLAPLLPRPEPAEHQSQPDHRHPPSIRRAPAGACGKVMPPVPDPYRGGD